MKKLFVVVLAFLMVISQNVSAGLVESQTLRPPVGNRIEDLEEITRDYSDTIYVGDRKISSIYENSPDVNEKLSRLLEYWGVSRMGLKLDSIRLCFPEKGEDQERYKKDISLLEKENLRSIEARKITKRILSLETYVHLLDIYAGKEGEFEGLDTIPVVTSGFMGNVYSPVVGFVSDWLKEEENKGFFDSFVRTDRYRYKFIEGNLVAPSKTWGKPRENVKKFTVTDGSAALGLGNIGEASIPIMFGKSVLLEAFGGKSVRSDICYVDNSKHWKVIKTTTSTVAQKRDAYRQITENIVKACKAIKEKHPDVAIMLEDIAAPVCFEAEERANKEGIFTIHDDQWGTAIIFAAGIINAIEKAGKDPKECKLVMSGGGASAYAVAMTLKAYGIGTLIAYDSRGAIHEDRADLTPQKQKLAEMNTDNFTKGIEAALVGADGFIGLSEPNIFNGYEIDMLKKMKPKSFVFAGANPDPEFNLFTIKGNSHPQGPLKNIAYYGSGAFGLPGTTLNNSSAFPGLYRALTDAIREGKLKKDTKEISIPRLALKCAQALALEATDEDFNEDSVVPRTFNGDGYNFKVTKAIAINAWQELTGDSKVEAKKRYKGLEKELRRNQDETIKALEKISAKYKKFMLGLIELLGQEDLPVVKRLKKAVRLKTSDIKKLLHTDSSL